MLFHLKQIIMTIMTIISAIIQLCLTISLGIHKTACWTNLFSGRSPCVETSHFICSVYRLTGFFAVGMSTDGVFRTGYTISFFVSLALSLLSFLRPLLIIFKFSVYLIFAIKCFFGAQDCAVQMNRGLVNFDCRYLGEMFTDVTSSSLWLFLNIPSFIRKSFTFKYAG